MNILSIFKPKPAAESPDVMERVIEAARVAARQELAEPAKNLQRAADSLELTRRPSPNVLEYNSIAYGMNDPRRYRDYTDPRNRPYGTVSVDTLRLMAKNYDVLSSCITHLKSEVVKTPIRVVAKDDKDQSRATRKQLEEASAFFDTNGGLGGAGTTRLAFDGEWMNDLLVIGACALMMDYETRGAQIDGNPDSVISIDASTIRPLIDQFGFKPRDEETAYEQIVMGVTTAAFRRDELIYEGMPIFAQTESPYFMSAVELLIFTIMSALKADEWNRTWLTDGNVPNRLISAPKEWTPDQIKEYAVYFDDLLAGDSRARHKARIVPDGTTINEQTRKDADFQEFEAWLRDRTCSLMGVNPASIGFHGNTYKDSQESAAKTTSEGRVAQLLLFRITLYNEIARRKGWFSVRVLDEMDDGEDANARATRHQLEIQSGQRTINETRQEDGMEAIGEPGASVLLVSTTLTTLEKAFAPPEVIPDMSDDEDDSPAPAKAKPDDPEAKPADVGRALGQWERKCLNRIARGQKAACGFEDESIDEELARHVMDALGAVETREDARRVFADIGGIMEN